MNSHAQPDLGIISQRLADFDCGPYWRFRCIKKDKGHSVPDRYSNQLPGCFRSAELFGSANDLIEPLQHLHLLVHQQFGITNHIDEEDVCDLKPQIRLWFCHNVALTLTAYLTRFNLLAARPR